MKNNLLLHDFYCTQCGHKSFPVWRNKGAKREAGHLKTLFCLYCQKETNFCEIDESLSKYTYNDFLLEFNNNNFTPEGGRILPYNLFKQTLDRNK